VPSLRTDLLATDPSTVKLASGKVELVVFFAYWDGNSRIMMPALLNLQDQFGSQINFIYLDSDDPATAPLKRALYYEPYGAKPQIFLLDSQGKVQRKWQGVVPQLELQQAIQAASGS
jgi:thiol-disulfide isomerase/thioredoxin